MRLQISVFAVWVALAAQPAEACSFSWAPGHSPKAIPHRDDVWRVRGDFSLLDAKTGAAFESGEINLTADTKELLGKIDGKGRKPIMTKQYYSEIAVECGAYLNPLGKASGTFWLERHRDRQGRYRLLMWRPAKDRAVAVKAQDGKQ